MSHKRCVAQLGRALRSGRRGRRFKSCRIDYKKTDTARYLFFYNQNERTGSVTSSVPNARSGAEGPRGPVDLGFGPTGAERRPQVQIYYFFVVKMVTLFGFCADECYMDFISEESRKACK